MYCTVVHKATGIPVVVCGLATIRGVFSSICIPSGNPIHVTHISLQRTRVSIDCNTSKSTVPYLVAVLGWFEFFANMVSTATLYGSFLIPYFAVVISKAIGSSVL